jgi:single-strand DNA-binding protein
MSDTISVTGLVATTPRHITTSEGLAITSFRLASSQRRYDRTQQRWIDADTNWYTVSCFRGLASNAAGSLVKGDRIMVSGLLKIRDWENTDRSGTTVEIEADNLGHDLFWGTSTFTRTLTSGTDESGSSVAETTEFAEGTNGDGWVAVSA